MIENANIWQVSTPDEAATVLLSIYETRAEEIALLGLPKQTLQATRTPQVSGKTCNQLLRIRAPYLKFLPKILELLNTLRCSTF